MSCNIYIVPQMSFLLYREQFNNLNTSVVLLSHFNKKSKLSLWNVCEGDACVSQDAYMHSFIPFDVGKCVSNFIPNTRLTLTDVFKNPTNGRPQGTQVGRPWPTPWPRPWPMYPTFAHTQPHEVNNQNLAWFLTSLIKRATLRAEPLLSLFCKAYVPQGKALLAGCNRTF